MLMVGDGALALLAPDEHLDTWSGGPGDRLVDAMHRRRWLVQLAGAIEVVIGLWVGIRGIRGRR